MIDLSLPYPPTVNHYWIRTHNGTGLAIGKPGRAFRERVAWAALEHPELKLGAKQWDIIIISVYPPDRRRRDLDNILKALLDALQHAGALEDDSQLDQILLVRKGVVAEGKVVVRLQNSADEQRIGV